MIKLSEIKHSQESIKNVFLMFFFNFQKDTFRIDIFDRRIERSSFIHYFDDKLQLASTFLISWHFKSFSRMPLHINYK